MKQVKSVVIMAGGTGGHIFPALAVAEALKQRGVAVHWLGTRKGLEADLVPARGFSISFLDVSGLRGQGVLRMFLAPFKLVRAVFAAIRVLRAVKADVVIGLGGYVTGPGGLAAKLLAKPLFIHEQNAIAGFTNRLLSRMATSVLTAFPNVIVSAKTVVVGNPVRAEIAALDTPECRFAQRDGALRIAILGGSQGAVALNRLVPEALALLKNAYDIEIRHQCGKANQEQTEALYHNLLTSAEVTPFVHDMAALYAWADLVICRSGALTVSEIAAAGVASILVPYPFAVDDHQTANARFLSDAGAALLLNQSEITAHALAEQLKPLLNRDVLLKMAITARGLAKTDATDEVVRLCLAVGVEQ